MPERRLTVVLSEADVHEFLRVVMDRDPTEALRFLERVVRPQIEAGLRPAGCRPVFELPHPDAGPVCPPPVRQGHVQQERPPGA